MSISFAPPSTVESNASIGAARARLAGWLLNSPVQQVDGDNAGSVAGWIDCKGTAGYAYPEITGYYLQWLATQALRGGPTPVLASRAAAAQRWLRLLCDRSGTFPTRVYLDADRRDWRNDASFAFDLAMVLRGLAWASRAALIATDEVVVARLCGELSELIAEDGIFRPVRSTGGHAPLPARWSTRRGSFLAKAASGVLFAAEELPRVPLRLQSCARSTLEAAAKWFAAESHDDTHAFFYAIEGFLSAPSSMRSPELFPRIATQFRALAADAQQHGRLAETRGAPGRQRLDIVAQAIRAGWLLRSERDEMGPELAFVSKMTPALVRHISATGALAFDPEADQLQLNAWTAMFAEQALDLAERRDGCVAQVDGTPCII